MLLTNYRVIPTCPHTIVSQHRYKTEKDEGMIVMCERCKKPVAWSTNNSYEEIEKFVEGKVTELTESEKLELA